MARMNAFLRAGNDNREVSVGGRSQSNGVWARLNTDNAMSHDVSLYVEAEVTGPGLTYRERRLKSVGDQRRTHFTVRLPKADQGATVYLELAGDWAKGLIAMGAALVGLQAAQEASEGRPKSAKAKLKAIEKILKEQESRSQDMPEVILPGGVTLAHALACVEIVKGLVNHEDDRKN